jgi:hypothetical protein
MQPVRVTSKGAAISLPLHMVAVGTGATTGITIYVVADGRWEPQNFPTFTITDSEISWDWTTASSNYETLRLSKEAAFKGRGWQIESSLELNRYTIESTLAYNIQSDKNGLGGYAPAPVLADAGTDASEAGSKREGGSPSDAGDAASPDAEGDDGESTTDSGLYPGLSDLADQDLAVLFTGISGGSVRITRLRSDVAHSALSEDMYLQASADQSELTNQYLANGPQIGQPLCPIYDDNCIQTGEVPRDQATADANGGCNTTRPRGASRMTLALLLGVASFGVVRYRRRRRRSR